MRARESGDRAVVIQEDSMEEVEDELIFEDYIRKMRITLGREAQKSKQSRLPCFCRGGELDHFAVDIAN